MRWGRQLSPRGQDSRQEGARYALLLVASITAVKVMDKSISSTVRGVVQKDLHLTNLEVAMPDTVFSITYAVFSLLAGTIVDMGVNRRLIIGTGVVLWSTATSLTALSYNLTALVTFRAIVGLAEGTVATTILPYLADFYPSQERQLAFAVVTIALSIGGSFGFIIGGILTEAFSWRIMYLMCGLFGLPLALGLPFANDPAVGINDAAIVIPSTTPPLREVFRGYLEVLTYLQFAIALSAATLLNFADGAQITYMPTYLIRYEGFTVAEAGLFSGTSLLVGCLFGVPLGAKAVLFSQNFVENAAFLVCGGFTLLAALISWCILNMPASSSILYALLIFWAIAISTVPAQAFTLSINSVPVQLRGRAQGVWSVVTRVMGTSSFPVVIGTIADSYDLETALQMIWLVMTLAALTWWLGHSCTTPLQDHHRASDEDLKEKGHLDMEAPRLSFISLLYAETPDTASLQDESYGTFYVKDAT